MMVPPFSYSNNKEEEEEEEEEEDSKCLYHKDDDIVYICDSCISPVCVKCIISTHNGHKFSELTIEKSQSIVNKFKQQFPSLEGYSNSDKAIMNSVEICYQQILEQHNSNLSLLVSKFKVLHNLLSIIELNIKKTLETKLSENQQTYLEIKSLIEIDNQTIENLIFKHSNNINNYDLNKLLSKEQQSEENEKEQKQKQNKYITLLKDSDKTNKLIERKLKNYEHFVENKLIYSQDILDTAIELIKTNFIIDNKEFKDLKSGKHQHLMIDKKIIIDCCKDKEFYITHGEPIPNNITNLAITTSTYSTLTTTPIPSTIKNLFIYDGFNQEINSELIPNTVEKLFFGNIQKPLQIGSIPTSVKEIIFYNGFNHIIRADTIPSSVTSISIGKIGQPLDELSLPRNGNLQNLYIFDGFPHPLHGETMIPSSVVKLFLGKLESPLTKYSLPNISIIDEPGNNNSSVNGSIKDLVFCNGFNQKVNSEWIPTSVNKLYICDIEEPLTEQSIPTTVNMLTFSHGYSYLITSDIMPKSIQRLYLRDIKEPLIRGSIGESVKELFFDYGYSHAINSEVIPPSVQSLYIHDILQPLTKESIPNTIQELYFDNGFSHIIKASKIPRSVQTLYIGSIKKPLTRRSIPSTIKELIFNNGFNFQITPDVFNNGFNFPVALERLYFYDIGQPLQKGSISDSVVRKLIFAYGFGHQISPDIIPSSVDTLYLGNIRQPLTPGSIPNTIRYLMFTDGFNHTITKGVIPDSVQEISLYDIKQIFTKGSIPSSVKLINLKGFKYNLPIDIVPMATKVK